MLFSEVLTGSLQYTSRLSGPAKACLLRPVEEWGGLALGKGGLLPGQASECEPFCQSGEAAVSGGVSRAATV